MRRCKALLLSVHNPLLPGSMRCNSQDTRLYLHQREQRHCSFKGVEVRAKGGEALRTSGTQ
jgi:hypothetical protein